MASLRWNLISGIPEDALSIILEFLGVTSYPQIIKLQSICRGLRNTLNNSKLWYKVRLIILPPLVFKDVVDHMHFLDCSVNDGTNLESPLLVSIWDSFEYRETFPPSVIRKMFMQELAEKYSAWKFWSGNNAVIALHLFTRHN